jgi:hypothetical protein
MTFTYSGDSVKSRGHGLIEVTNDNVNYSIFGEYELIQGGEPGQDEVQARAIFTASVSSGSYLIVFGLNTHVHGPQFLETDPIDFEADDVDIADAIDLAGSIFVTGWSGYEIEVSGAPLTNTDVEFTFSGPSFTELPQDPHFLGNLDLVHDPPPGDFGPITRDKGGQPNRTILAALKIMSLVDSGPPTLGSTTGVVAITDREDNAWFPHQEALQAWALEGAIEEGTDDMYTVLMTELGLSHLL